MKIDFEKLQENMNKSANDYMRNETPYKHSIEERSGFSSGVTWTLKKLKKLGLLNINEYEKGE